MAVFKLYKYFRKHVADLGLRSSLASDIYVNPRQSSRKASRRRNKKHMKRKGI